MPHTDLLVSPDHAVFVDGKLICARQLINGTTIRQETGWTAVEYFHVELDAHAILLAEGLPAESYLDTGNRGFFANSGEPLVLHPDLTDETDYPTREAGSCAPFVWDEASVRPVWQRLAERAAALGQPAPKLDDDHRSGSAHRGQGPDGAAAVWRERARTSSPCRRVRPRCAWSRVPARRPTRGRGWRIAAASACMWSGSCCAARARCARFRSTIPSLSQGWWAVERDGSGDAPVDRRRCRAAAAGDGMARRCWRSAPAAADMAYLTDAEQASLAA